MSLVNKKIEVISNATESNCSSNPYNGKILMAAVTPNNPRKAGNKPTKQPGHAPPSKPPNTPKAVNPDSLFRCLSSLNFAMIRLIFRATKKATSKVNMR